MEKLTFFQRGYPMVLVQKGLYLEIFFLGNIRLENVFYDILERKNAFLAIKKRSSNSRKIDIFPKVLIHGFGQKVVIFPTFFRQYTPGKCLLRYSRTKQCLSRL